MKTRRFVDGALVSRGTNPGGFRSTWMGRFSPLSPLQTQTARRKRRRFSAHRALGGPLGSLPLNTRSPLRGAGGHNAETPEPATIARENDDSSHPDEEGGDSDDEEGDWPGQSRNCEATEPPNPVSTRTEPLFNLPATGPPRENRRTPGTSLSLGSAGWLLASAFGFALMGVLTHELGHQADWSVIALARAIFMLGAALALARHAGIRLPIWRPTTLWIRSIAGAFGMMCNFYALTVLPVADVLTLTNTFPLWIGLLSWLTLGQSLGRFEWAAIGLGVVGVAVLQQPHFDQGGLAILLALASAVSTAIAMLGLHRLKGVDARAVVAHLAAVGGLTALGAVLWRWDSASLAFDGWTARDGTLLVGVGVCGTASQLFLTRAYAASPPGRLAPLSLSQVLFAVILEAILFGRLPTAWAWVGFALVLIPTAAIMTQAARPPSTHRLAAPSPNSRDSRPRWPRLHVACRLPLQDHRALDGVRRSS